jgi:hypothetical protein
VVPIRLPARGTAQQVANSSHEGTTRRRFRPSKRISQLLSEFALLGSMDPASKLPHTARSQPPRGPNRVELSRISRHTFLTQKQGTGVGKSTGDRDSSRVLCAGHCGRGEDPDAGNTREATGLSRQFSVPGHRSVIMFGVLEVVFRCDNVARPDFFLGKREISLVASLSASGTVLFGAVGIRRPPLWAGNWRHV